MTNGSRNAWKLTAMGLVLSIVVALVTGLVVASWTGPRPEGEGQAVTQGHPPATVTPPRPAPHAVASAPAPAVQARPAPAPAAPAPPVPRIPGQSAIEGCNRYAASLVGQQDKTMEVVKDSLIGALTGAAVGAAGGAIAGGGKGAGTGAAIGGLVGAGGGTLYGLNENRRSDERYREAYASCMNARGYTG